MNCNFCKGSCVKKGFYKTTQRYQCRQCRRYQQRFYRNKKYCAILDDQIEILSKEGVGISSIGRILSIPRASVQRRIERMKKERPTFTESGQVYEVDELYTYVGRKSNPCYIIYAINRRTRQVIDFVCGARTRENISKVIKSLLARSPRRIYTDGLTIYRHLIPQSIHATLPYRTNRIERKNLTLRTHLKRLSRKTICYSKTVKMLEACFRLYAWAHQH